MDRSSLEHGSYVRGCFMDASGMAPFALGVARWTASASASGNFQLLDEQLLGRGGTSHRGRPCDGGPTAACSLVSTARLCPSRDWFSPTDKQPPPGRGLPPYSCSCLSYRMALWQAKPAMDNEVAPVLISVGRNSSRLRCLLLLLQLAGDWKPIPPALPRQRADLHKHAHSPVAKT